MARLTGIEPVTFGFGIQKIPIYIGFHKMTLNVSGCSLIARKFLKKIEIFRC